MNKNLLAEYGYLALAAPKAGFDPLLLLTREGKTLTSLDGDVTLLFEPGTNPLPKRDNEVADISRKYTLSSDGGGSLNLLAGLFSALKLDQAAAKTGLQALSAREIEIAYEEVTEDKVGIPDLDNFLTGAIPKEGEFRTLERLLYKSDLYVVTSVLKSRRFNVRVVRSGKTTAELKLAMDKLVELDPKFERKSNDELIIQHDGEEPLTVACKAARIIYDKRAWFEFWKRWDAGFRIKNQRGLTVRGEQNEDTVEMLDTKNGLLDLS